MLAEDCGSFVHVPHTEEQDSKQAGMHRDTVVIFSLRSNTISMVLYTGIYIPVNLYINMFIASCQGTRNCIALFQR